MGILKDAFTHFNPVHVFRGRRKVIEPLNATPPQGANSRSFDGKRRGGDESYFMTAMTFAEYEKSKRSDVEKP